MDDEPELARRHLMNHLAVMKLAVQMLDRRAGLSDDEHTLALTAIGAADALAADLSAGWPNGDPEPLPVFASTPLLPVNSLRSGHNSVW